MYQSLLKMFLCVVSTFIGFSAHAAPIPEPIETGEPLQESYEVNFAGIPDSPEGLQLRLVNNQYVAIAGQAPAEEAVILFPLDAHIPDDAVVTSDHSKSYGKVTAKLSESRDAIEVTIAQASSLAYVTNNSGQAYIFIKSPNGKRHQLTVQAYPKSSEIRGGANITAGSLPHSVSYDDFNNIIKGIYPAKGEEISITVSPYFNYKNYGFKLWAEAPEGIDVNVTGNTLSLSGNNPSDINGSINIYIVNEQDQEEKWYLTSISLQLAADETSLPIVKIGEWELPDGFKLSTGEGYMMISGYPPSEAINIEIPFTVENLPEGDQIKSDIKEYRDLYLMTIDLQSNMVKIHIDSDKNELWAQSEIGSRLSLTTERGFHLFDISLSIKKANSIQVEPNELPEGVEMTLNRYGQNQLTGKFPPIGSKLSFKIKNLPDGAEIIAGGNRYMSGEVNGDIITYTVNNIPTSESELGSLFVGTNDTYQQIVLNLDIPEEMIVKVEAIDLPDGVVFGTDENGNRTLTGSFPALGSVLKFRVSNLAAYAGYDFEATNPYCLSANIEKDGDSYIVTYTVNNITNSDKYDTWAYISARKNSADEYIYINLFRCNLSVDESIRPKLSIIFDDQLPGNLLVEESSDNPNDITISGDAGKRMVFRFKVDASNLPDGYKVHVGSDDDYNIRNYINIIRESDNGNVYRVEIQASDDPSWFAVRPDAEQFLVYARREKGEYIKGENLSISIRNDEAKNEVLVTPIETLDLDVDSYEPTCITIKGNFPKKGETLKFEISNVKLPEGYDLELNVQFSSYFTSSLEKLNEGNYLLTVTAIATPLESNHNEVISFGARNLEESQTFIWYGSINFYTSVSDDEKPYIKVLNPEVNGYEFDDTYQSGQFYVISGRAPEEDITIAIPVETNIELPIIARSTYLIQASYDKENSQIIAVIRNKNFPAYVEFGGYSKFDNHPFNSNSAINIYQQKPDGSELWTGVINFELENDVLKPGADIELISDMPDQMYVQEGAVSLPWYQGLLPAIGSQMMFKVDNYTLPEGFKLSFRLQNDHDAIICNVVEHDTEPSAILTIDFVKTPPGKIYQAYVGVTAVPLDINNKLHYSLGGFWLHDLRFPKVNAVRPSNDLSTPDEKDKDVTTFKPAVKDDEGNVTEMPELSFVASDDDSDDVSETFEIDLDKDLDEYGEYVVESTDEDIAWIEYDHEKGHMHVHRGHKVGNCKIHFYFHRYPGHEPHRMNARSRAAGEETPAEEQALFTMVVETRLPSTADKTIRLSTTSISGHVDDQVSLTATVGGFAAQVEWRSSDESVATVSPDGVVTIVGTGKANIVASFDGEEAICTVTTYKVIVNGIEGVNADAERGEAVIYDLTGRRIERIHHSGIYIINGVKAFVR